MEYYACSDCWMKVEAFNEFYLMIEAIHQTNLNEFDKKVEFLSPTICDYGSAIDNEHFIKHENDALEVCIEECNAVYIPNPLILDEPDRQIDQCTDQTIANNKKQSKYSKSKSATKKQSIKLETKVKRTPKSSDQRLAYRKSKTSSKKAKLKSPKKEPKNRKTIRTVDEIR